MNHSNQRMELEMAVKIVVFLRWIPRSSMKSPLRAANQSPMGRKGGSSSHRGSLRDGEE
jgi:hypothetical protein